jgi:hypothetical protein|tara:strand:- start:486 stop:668 length:183 start_codon:yes stop_codon:yes gene_type:complete
MAELQTKITNLYEKKKSLDQKWDEDHKKENRYTLNMVKIDIEVKNLITRIKAAEAELARI